MEIVALRKGGSPPCFSRECCEVFAPTLRGGKKCEVVNSSDRPRKRGPIGVLSVPRCFHSPIGEQLYPRLSRVHFWDRLERADRRSDFGVLRGSVERCATLRRTLRGRIFSIALTAVFRGSLLLVKVCCSPIGE